uniref:Uncharacterized protein n=1 Tax=Strigamia maritima TaxID=126957 RepID=T1J8Y2_STRMM
MFSHWIIFIELVILVFCCASIVTSSPIFLKPIEEPRLAQVTDGDALIYKLLESLHQWINETNENEVIAYGDDNDSPLELFEWMQERVDPSRGEEEDNVEYLKNIKTLKEMINQNQLALFDVKNIVERLENHIKFNVKLNKGQKK